MGKQKQAKSKQRSDLAIEIMVHIINNKGVLDRLTVTDIRELADIFETSMARIASIIEKEIRDRD